MGEGLTTVKNIGCTFAEAVELLEHELLGNFKAKWPLIKILDKGLKLDDLNLNLTPRFPSRQIAALWPLRRDCARLRDCRIS